MAYDVILLVEELPVERRLPIVKSHVSSVYDNYDICNPPIYTVHRDQTVYFKHINHLTCFINGTNFQKANNVYNNSTNCPCRSGWYGQWCSFMPILVNDSPMINLNNIYIRKRPRKIILATPFNIEYEMLESRLGELGDVVDVFIICESNYTAYGDPKPLRLLDKLKQGYLKKYHHKIVYVFLPHFPDKAYRDGWIADSLPRNYMGTQGVKKQLKGYEREDIIMYMDADEIPSRETILFFKLHDGFPEPFGLRLKMTTFGFFWNHENGETKLPSGATIGLVEDIFNFQLSKLRDPTGMQFKNNMMHFNSQTKRYIAETKHEIMLWYMGDITYYAGWHCTYCFTPEGVRIKLMSTINADFPRWGDIWGKLDLSDIRHRMRKGMWFDDHQELLIPDKNIYYPQLLNETKDRFSYLLIKNQV